MFARSVCSTRAIAAGNGGEPTDCVRGVDDGHQPIAAEAGEVAFNELAGLADCEPLASQPAPESAVSTRGAKNPSTTATEPSDEHRAKMGGGVAAEPADRAHGRGMLKRRLGGPCGWGDGGGAHQWACWRG